MKDEKEYIQVYEPDKESLAKALSDCRGEKRTMAQFAEATGISAPTLSRILNRNITKPLSIEILKSIYENRAEKCKIELDDLYRANGMLPREERNRVLHAREGRRRSEEIEEQAQQMIINEILLRGYTIKADIAKGLGGHSGIMAARTDEQRGDLRIWYDFAIILPELSNLSEWLFEIVSGPVQSIFGNERSPEAEARFRARRILQFKNTIFLVDAWQPERLKGTKFSWVFTDRYVYDAFKEYLKTAKLNNAMSTILVDLNEKAVVKEEWMNCPMKDHYVSLFRDPDDKSSGTNYYRRQQEIQSRAFSEIDE